MDCKTTCFSNELGDVSESMAQCSPFKLSFFTQKSQAFSANILFRAVLLTRNTFLSRGFGGREILPGFLSSKLTSRVTRSRLAPFLPPMPPQLTSVVWPGLVGSATNDRRDIFMTFNDEKCRSNVEPCLSDQKKEHKD